MKLYRGLKTREFAVRGKKVQRESLVGFREILKRREVGNFNYPEDLNEVILKLSTTGKLSRQAFTDNKEIAETYAKENGGVLIEIEVSIDDILKYFLIEFQNFSKRRSRFELVYEIENTDLVENMERWKCKITKY